MARTDNKSKPSSTEDEWPDAQEAIGSLHRKGMDYDRLQAEKSNLVELVKLAYRNWLEDPDVAWGELGKHLCDGLCESMGDKEFQDWLKALKE